MTGTIHPDIADYARRHGLDPLVDADGGFAVRIDGRHRIRLIPAGDGMLVLRARLAELPDGWQARAAHLRQAGLLASAMAPATDAYCGIDEGETALYLHQRVAPAGSALAVDEAVGEFVNALATWKRAMARWQ